MAELNELIAEVRSIMSAAVAATGEEMPDLSDEQIETALLGKLNGREKIRRLVVELTEALEQAMGERE